MISLILGGLKMKKYLKNRFELTNKGADGVSRAAISSFFVFLIMMLIPVIMMLFMDNLILGNLKPNYYYYGSSILVLIILFIAISVEYENTYKATYKESENLRIELARKFLSLPVSYFSKHDTSDMAQTFMEDVTKIEHALSHSIPKMTAFYMFLPLMTILLIFGNYKMGLSVIIPLLASFFLIPLSRKVLFEGNKKIYKVLRRNTESFQEAIELHQEIEAYNLTKEIKDKLYKEVEEGEKTKIKSEFTALGILSISNLFSYVSLALVLIVGTRLMIKGEINILYTLGYLVAAMKISELIEVSKLFVMEAYTLEPCIQRFKEINETKTQEGVNKDLKNFDIDLQNVEFSYDNGRKILKGIDFNANQNEVTALVGPSGCGKSTLLKVISRLYDYDSGEILIDGVDIKKISTDSLFSKIGIVFQDVILFNTSVMENIRLGRNDANDDEVLEAARLANCMEFIEKMPDGIMTDIGENGVKISGGERQRISIARAFLKDAPILILDEIASSLDIENENKIQESLNKLTKNKTVIIISHRMKSIENVDKIVVIDKGRVLESGTHDELIKNSGLYKDLILKSKLAEEFKY